MNETVILSGVIDNIVFCNRENFYTVMNFETETGVVTAVGILPFAGEGLRLAISGSWTTHPQYGSQFLIQGYEKQPPETTEEIAVYLSSGLFKGIGTQTAVKITGAFGLDTYKTILDSPAELYKISGISKKTADKLSSELMKIASLDPIVEFFSKNGLDTAIALKAYKAYGANALNLIKANPYLLSDDEIGADFRLCDDYALRLGFEYNDSLRVSAGIKYVLQHNLTNGHTFIPFDKLIAAAAAFLTVDSDLVEGMTEIMLKSGELVRDADVGGKDAVYLLQYYNAERFCAKRLISMTSKKSRHRSYKADIEEIENFRQIRFNDKQKAAIEAAVNNKISVLTGGPGTGKTTVLIGMIEILESLGKKVLLAAPTGRAAKRMQELTGRESKTIHRLLEIEANENGFFFQRNELNLLEGDVVIIDEASMVDLLLIVDLLRAMPEDMGIVLIGDANQLPPVSAGNFFKNLLDSSIVSEINLTEVFRQTEDSVIITNAHKINSGQMPVLDNTKSDFFFMKRNTAMTVNRTIEELCRTRLPEAYGFSPFRDIQVIVPSRKTETGTEVLNRRLQDSLNSENAENAVKFGETEFRLGDKVMQVKNDYQINWVKENGESGKGIYNGDIGFIVDVSKREKNITVRFDDKYAVYIFEKLDMLELAYAITVHKSQGSEFEAVIMPVFCGGQRLFNRCLLYTAVTRAKKMVILVGIKERIAEMVSNNETAVKYCGLKYQIKKLLENQ